MNTTTTKLSVIAQSRIEDGESPSALVHRLWAGDEVELSSSITLDDWRKGGYTEVYRSLGRVAEGCWD